MTTHLITRKEQKLQLDGNLLTGDTYPLKGFIKECLGGRWNANATGWTIDPQKLEKILKGNSIGLRIDNAPQRQTKSSGNNGYCRKCHSYCYGDCSAN